MLKYCSLAVLSLAALGLGAGQASAAGWLKNWCCCHKYTVCCKPYNAFSPPCCTPCGKGWPCCMEPFAMGGCGHGGCGYGGGCADGSCGAPMGAPAMGGSSAPATMPPATSIPNYMPPAPAEVGDAPQGAMPMMPVWPQAMPQAMPMQMMRPVVFQPNYGPAYYPQPAYYPMPGMGMPQMQPMQAMPQMQRGW